MNKTLKKVLIICVCVVLIVGIAGAIWFWDMTRIIESPYPEVVAIGKNENKGGAVAYSITQHPDKIVLTNYCTAGIVKSIVTFNLENDIVVSATRETHYETKWDAHYYAKTEENRKAKGNVLYTLKLDTAEIGMTSSELIQSIESGHSDITKIDEIK